MKARLYLFYGTDSQASFSALKRWEAAFVKKFGDVSRYVLEADEGSPEELATNLMEALQSDTLFSLPKFISIKRVTAKERGNSTAYSRAVLDTLKKRLSDINEDVTVVVWESHDLSPNHVLLKSWKEWQSSGLADSKKFNVPAANQVASAITGYVKELGGTIDSPSMRWLQSRYQALEKEARLAKRLKANQDLLEDERIWWLHNLLDQAFLASKEGAIVLSLLEKVDTEQPVVQGPFDVIAAIQHQDFDLAQRIIASQDGDEGFAFSLLAACKWKVGQSGLSGFPPQPYARKLLAETELLLKNFTVPSSVVVSLLIERFRLYSQDRREQDLVSARKLWLAHLSRA